MSNLNLSTMPTAREQKVLNVLDHNEVVDIDTMAKLTDIGTPTLFGMAYALADKKQLCLYTRLAGVIHFVRMPSAPQPEVIPTAHPAFTIVPAITYVAKATPTTLPVPAINPIPTQTPTTAAPEKTRIKTPELLAAKQQSKAANIRKKTQVQTIIAKVVVAGGAWVEISLADLDAPGNLEQKRAWIYRTADKTELKLQTRYLAGKDTLMMRLLTNSDYTLTTAQ